MKKLYILSLLVLASFSVQAISYTSTQNGNWMSPTTWSPLGVPIPGDDIIINHDVILDTDFAFTSGSITINNSGSLIQDATGRDIWMNGANADISSFGMVTVRDVLLSNGTFTVFSATFRADAIANFITMDINNGSLLRAVDSMYNDGTINNNSVILSKSLYNNNLINNNGEISNGTFMDSLFNAGTIINNWTIYADSCTNTGTITSNHLFQSNQFTNTGTFTNTDKAYFVDMTNIGTFTNLDSLSGTGSFTNTGNFINQTGAFFELAISFLNADPVNSNALFTANGRFVIGDSFYNFDGITGVAPGSIQVQDTSYNHTTGTMTGSFDFCDLTPPVTPIKIDLNLGTVDPLITYCTWTGVELDYENSTISIYPNPTNGFINITVDRNVLVEVYNVLGERIINTTNSKIDISTYQNGIYFVLLKDGKGNLIKQEKIVKY